MEHQLLFGWMKRFCPCFGALANLDWNKSDDRLLQAVEQNDPDKIAALLVKKGLCTSKLNPEGKSAFHLSVSRGRVDCLEIFLSHGVDISSTDSSGLNALHLAAKNGHVTCVKRLLQEGAPVDSTDSLGRTALHHAAAHGSLVCTETLGDLSTCLDAQDADGVTPLLLAAQMGWAAICDVLLTRGADANLPDNSGRLPLMLACEMNNVDTVQALLRGGAKPQLADGSQQCVSTGPGNTDLDNQGVQMKEMLKLKTGREFLLQRKNDLEEQQHTALSALEEQLKQIELERNQLLLAIQEFREAKKVGSEEELNPLELSKPLSPWSRDSDHEFLSAQEDCLSQGDADSLCTPASPGDQLAWCALQENMEVQSDLVLKAQSDTESVDMQSACSLLVPIALYDSVEEDSEVLQEPHHEVQGVAVTSHTTDRCVDNPKEEHDGGAVEEGALKDRLREVEEELSQALAELEKLRIQVKVLDTEEPAEGEKQKVLQKGKQEQEKEQEEVMITGESPVQQDVDRRDADSHAHGDGVWSKEVEQEKEPLAQRQQGGEGNGIPAPSLRLIGSNQQGVLQDELEMEITLGLQLEQLPQERVDVAAKLNKPLLDLERLRPPPQVDKKQGEKEGDTQLSFKLDCFTQTSGASVEGAVMEQQSAEELGVCKCLCEKEDLVPTLQNQEVLDALNYQLSRAAMELQEEKVLRWQAQQEISRLQADLDTIQQDAMSRHEHETVNIILQRSLEASENRLQEVQQNLKDVQQGVVSREDHEAQSTALQAQIVSLTARLAGLSRKHQDTCFELLRVQREALFSKMARQTVEAQLSTARRHLADLKSQGVGMAKEESRIPELSKEVFLKESLEAPLPLLGIPSLESSGQQLMLKSGVTSLTRQLQDWEQKHRAVVSVYRAHLLAAVQGRMDEEVQALLLQILRMTQTEPGY